MVDVVNLFWTGGWDSTFRLLETVVLNQKCAQPYYIVDPKRASYKIELQVMENIRKMITQYWPEAADLVRATALYYLKDIAPCPEITQLYKSITARERLGGQYEWMARLAKQLNLNNLEVALEKDIDAGTSKTDYIGRNVMPYLVLEDPEDPTSFCLKDPYPDPNAALFSRFRFPIVRLTKLDMQRLAQAHGFYHVMKQTWFCHKPTTASKPCGVCVPCQVVVEEGMSYRLPFRSRMLHFYEIRVKRQLKQFIKSSLAFKYPEAV